MTDGKIEFMELQAQLHNVMCITEVVKRHFLSSQEVPATEEEIEGLIDLCDEILIRARKLNTDMETVWKSVDNLHISQSQGFCNIFIPNKSGVGGKNVKIPQELANIMSIQDFIRIMESS